MSNQDQPRAKNAYLTPMIFHILKFLVVALVWFVFVVSMGLMVAYWTAHSVERGSIRDIDEHLTNQLTAAVERDRLGCASLVLIQNGLVKTMKGFGVAEFEKESIADPNRNRFVVASVSKAVTAWGVMKLVEEKIISLDEPVINYLKRWNFHGSDARRNRVTTRHLLSHTAGIEDGLGYGGFTNADSVQSLEESLFRTRDRTFGKNEPVTIAREPGTFMSYSGASYAILQLLIEDVTGKSFNDFMKETVFSTLGMRSSTFDIAELDGPSRSDLAPHYDASLVPQPVRYYAAKAPVSLSTTATDLAKFAIAHFQNNPVLSQETISTMIEPQHATNGSWGLGLTLYTTDEKGETEVFGHDGGTLPAWGAWLRINRTTKNAAILLVSGGSGAVNQLMHDWLYWETGKITRMAWLQRFYDGKVHSTIIFITGLIVLGILWFRRSPSQGLK